MMTIGTPRSEKPDGFSRGDGVAIWRRIADRMEAEIAEGGLSTGAQLPTEAELADRFGVNRHTVRRAIASLISEGVVRSAQGRGTFVQQARIPYPIGARTRFSEIMTAEGHTAGSEFIGAETVPASAEIAARLTIGVGSPVLRMHMKRSSDGIPVSLGVSHLPLPRFAGFAAAFREANAVSPALAACGVPDYRRLETRVGARQATDAEAAALGLDEPQILLSVDSVSVDPQGVPIQATAALFAADRIELVIKS